MPDESANREVWWEQSGYEGKQRLWGVLWRASWSCRSSVLCLDDGVIGGSNHMMCQGQVLVGFVMQKMRLFTTWGKYAALRGCSTGAEPVGRDEGVVGARGSLTCVC